MKNLLILIVFALVNVSACRHQDHQTDAADLNAAAGRNSKRIEDAKQLANVLIKENGYNQNIRYIATSVTEDAIYFLIEVIHDRSLAVIARVYDKEKSTAFAELLESMPGYITAILPSHGMKMFFAERSDGFDYVYEVTLPAPNRAKPLQGTSEKEARCKTPRGRWTAGSNKSVGCRVNHSSKPPIEVIKSVETNGCEVIYKDCTKVEKISAS